MRKLRRPIAAATALAVAISAGPAGCGTIFGLAAKQSVRVTSRPADGAKIYLDGVDVGEVTPGTVRLDPLKAAYSVTCEKGDLKSGGTNVSRDIRVWVVILDALLTLCIGIPIDYMTGGMYSFPEAVLCNMGKAPEPSEPAPPPTPPSQRQPPPPPPPPEPTRTDISSTKKICKVCGALRGDGPTCAQCGSK